MESTLKPKIELMELKLAKNLKGLLAQKHMTAIALSRASGVPNTTIANWIAGVPPRNVMQVRQVANFFGVSVDDLLFGSGQKVTVSTLDRLEEELHAGIYEVVLRKVKLQGE